MEDAAEKFTRRYHNNCVSDLIDEGMAVELPPVNVIPPEEQTLASLWDISLKITCEASQYHWMETPNTQDYVVTISTSEPDTEDSEEDGLKDLTDAGEMNVTAVEWEDMGTRDDMFWEFDASDYVPVGVATLFDEDGSLIEEIGEAWDYDEKLLVITDLELHPDVRGKGVLQTSLLHLQRCLGGIPVVWAKEDIAVCSYLRSLGFIPGPFPEFLWLPSDVMEGWAANVCSL